MNTRRLLPLGLAVAALLVVAGIASHGRPLAGGRGRGPTATFFDYVATTLVIYALVILCIAIWSLFGKKVGGSEPPRRRWNLISFLVMLIGSLLFAALISRSSFIEHLRNLEAQANKKQQPRAGLPTPAAEPPTTRNPRLRWDEIGVVVALLAGTAVVLVAGRQTKRVPRLWGLRREETVSAAIDESLDDLRNDPDLRRAIVAAYSRMEHALARAGLPRHPAEAPFEYVERALGSLDTSAESVHRLTGLFEWAKFSQHEPEPQMRDEAIDALVAVRDELRAPEREAVPT